MGADGERDATMHDGPEGAPFEPVGATIRPITRAGRRHPCPNCGSQSVARIMVGLPAPGVLEDREREAGEYILGGCMVWPDMPRFHCHRCGWEWAPPRGSAEDDWSGLDAGPSIEPIERRSWLASELTLLFPPVISDERKRLIASIAAPADAVHRGRIDYSRWASMPLPELVAPGVAERLPEIRDGWFAYERDADPEAARQRVAWYVNFADPLLFGFYGEFPFAQDEVQVAEHPALASVREALLADGLPALTEEGGQPTPVLVAGVERRIAIDTAPDVGAGRPYGLYGGRNLHSVSDAAVKRAIVRLVPPTRTNVLAIAAPRESGSRRPYTREEIERTLRTAYTGFRAAVLESRRLVAERAAHVQAAGGLVLSTEAGVALGPAPARPAVAEVVVHTGFWGCGAFGGNRVLMTLLQVIAAQAAGVDRVVTYAGEPAARSSVDRALAIARDLTFVTGRDALIDRIAALGLAWGNSDGN